MVQRLSVLIDKAFLQTTPQKTRTTEGIMFKFTVGAQHLCMKHDSRRATLEVIFSRENLSD